MRIYIFLKHWSGMKSLTSSPCAGSGRIVMSAGIPVVMPHEWNGNQMSPCWHSTYCWSLWFSVQHPGKCHLVSPLCRLDISILQLWNTKKNKAKYPRWCLYATRTDLLWCIAVAILQVHWSVSCQSLWFLNVSGRWSLSIYVYLSLVLHLAHLEMFKDGW